MRRSLRQDGSAVSVRDGLVVRGYDRGPGQDILGGGTGSNILIQD
jgi:hypothetical protein